MASGMMAELVTPVRKRANASRPSEARQRAQRAAHGGGEAGDGDHRHLAVAVAERAVHQDEDAVGEQERRRGDRGAPTVTPNSMPSWTSSGSITRMLAAEAKAATDSRTMAKAGRRGRGAAAGGGGGTSGHCIGLSGWRP